MINLFKESLYGSFNITLPLSQKKDITRLILSVIKVFLYLIFLIFNFFVWKLARLGSQIGHLLNKQMKNDKLQNIPLNLYFYSISDFQVIRNFSKKIRNLFPKKHYEKIQMNPAINKQKKKNPKIFWVTKQKIFQRN